MKSRPFLFFFLLLLPCVPCIPWSPLSAAEPAVRDWLAKPVLGPRLALAEAMEFTDRRVVRLAPAATAADWEKEADRLRREVFAKVVFRGPAAAWRDAKTKAEVVGTLPGGDGYSLKKVRYEILPGFWVPGILYEPAKPSGKVPVHLAVNGHDAAGTAADYKQTRCINLARRGMIVLNLEWLGMGQLRDPANQHGAINQIDLCGASGVAVHYLAMSRGIDYLLSHPNADPGRVAVSGLSGGGWQTIFISGLDTRVTLANPVAGYSSFRTRSQYHKDLGDSEQTPTDLGAVADYAHLTAMRAPRPTLLTFNAKDNCCFESGYTLPPLLTAAEPCFQLFGKPKNLRTHVNYDPGDHNFGKENREAFYRAVGDYFFPGDKSFSAAEVECKGELKSRGDLRVPLPDGNLSVNGLALKLAAGLPRGADWPADKSAADAWQTRRRKELAAVVKLPDYAVRDAAEVGKGEAGGVRATLYSLKVGEWTVPVAEFDPGNAKGTTIVIADNGRATVTPDVERLLKAGQRVLAADPFFFGEARPQPRDFLWALMVATVGERPRGVAAGQLAAVAGWAAGRHKGDVRVLAVGPRVGTVALVAAATGPTIAGVELIDPYGSLKQLIDDNKPANAVPEQFCFGLLESFDVVPVAALVAPRPVTVRQPSDRAKAEFARLAGWYRTLGHDHDPLK